MIISDKPEDLDAIATHCPFAASVISDAKGARFHIIFLGMEKAETEAEIMASVSHGLTVEAGAIGLTLEGERHMVAKPGFEGVMARASIVFRYAIFQCKSELRELERMAGLIDPRAAA